MLTRDETLISICLPPGHRLFQENSSSSSSRAPRQLLGISHQSRGQSLEEWKQAGSRAILPKEGGLSLLDVSWGRGDNEGKEKGAHLAGPKEPESTGFW